MSDLEDKADPRCRLCHGTGVMVRYVGATGYGVTCHCVDNCAWLTEMRDAQDKREKPRQP